jgi:hypothetical protein
VDMGVAVRMACLEAVAAARNTNPKGQAS